MSGTDLPPTSRIEEVARRIADGRRDKRTVARLEPRLHPSWDEVYPIQDRVHDLLDRPDELGWKVGAASEEVQRLEGMPAPVVGRVYPGTVHESGTILPPELFINFRTCECEVAVELSTDLPARPDPWTVEEVAAAIGWVFPVIEVGDLVFDDWYGVRDFFGTCIDNAGASQLVRGERRRYEPGLDLAGIVISLFHNDEYVRDGHTVAAMGDPVVSATWTVNLRRRGGHGLRAGSIISTGTCTGHCFAETGDTVEARFTGLGDVTARFG